MSVLSEFKVQSEQITAAITKLNQQRPNPPVVKVRNVVLKVCVWDNGLSMSVDLFVCDAHKVSLSAETLANLYEAIGQLLNDQPAGVEQSVNYTDQAGKETEMN